MADSPRIAELQEKFEDNPRRYFASLANEYRKAGDSDLAISVCQSILDVHPNHAAGQVVLGQALHQTGKLQEAADRFRTVLDLDPENLVALKALGDFAEKDGDTAAAREFYRKILRVDPGDERIFSKVALGTQLNARTSDLEDATTLLPELEAEYRHEIAEPVEPEAAEETLLVPDLMEGEDVGEAPSLEPDAAVAPPEPADTSATQELFEPIKETAARTGEFLGPIDFAGWTRPPVETGIPPDESESADFSGGELAGPFITETVAELYVQQGFTGEALVVYRQLERIKPDDEHIRRRIADLEQRLAVEHSARQASFEPELAKGEDAPEENETVAALELPESQSLWDSTDIKTAWEEPDRSETEDWFVVPDVSRMRTRQTVRDFFAVLGRAKPEHVAVPVRPRVTSDDIRAAADIAAGFGAFGSEQKSVPKAIAAKKGEENPQDDVRRFRAWLDGLSDS